MASMKQVLKWQSEAEEISNNPDYIKAYVLYKQEAKKADQRLVRLEALSHEKHFHGVLEFSYKRAIKDIQSWQGDKRFNTAPFLTETKMGVTKTRPLTLTELQAKTADIEHFISRPTSTKRGIVAIYKKRADTINAKYGADFGVKFTWQDLANYYESEKAEKDDKVYASKTLVRALAVIKGIATKKDLQKIDDVNKRVERISQDKVVNRVAMELLKDGYDYDKLMKD